MKKKAKLTNLQTKHDMEFDFFLFFLKKHTNEKLSWSELRYKAGCSAEKFNKL